MKNPYAERSREELKSLRRDMLNLRTGHLREAERLMHEIRRVSVALRDTERENIAVSDHALIRWMERVEGVDTQAIRRRIIQAINDGDRVGDGFVIPYGNVRICMAENRVTTVLEPPQLHPSTTRQPPAEIPRPTAPDPIPGGREGGEKT